MQFLKKNYGWMMVILLSFWAIAPFFASGFFPIHDDTQVARVFEMGKVLKMGIFPVRVVPDLGYGFGYPIFNFYAPFAYYIGAAFMFLGFDALISTKIMMALGIMLSGIFMYFLSKEFFGKIGGIISGLFYIYAPYHAVDIYIRGDVAEFWAYAFIPLAFLGLYKKNIPLGVLGLAGLILSHNLTALMVAPFLLIAGLLTMIFSKKENRASISFKFLKITLLGLAISAFYWIPVFAEMKNTNVLSQIGGGANFRDNFVCLQQLWNSPWGFGGSVPGCIDGLSFKIGKVQVLISIAVFIIALCLAKIRKSSQGKIIFLSFLGFLISIFLTLEISKPVWEAISPMAFFQYPWRFLIMTSFFSSILAGALIYVSRQIIGSKYYLIALLLAIILLFYNAKLFVPQTVLSKTAIDYTNEKTLKWTVSKISDEYLPRNFKKPKSQSEVYQGAVDLRARETGIEKISNIISLIGFLAFALAIIRFKDKQNYE